MNRLVFCHRAKDQPDRWGKTFATRISFQSAKCQRSLTQTAFGYAPNAVASRMNFSGLASAKNSETKSAFVFEGFYPRFDFKNWIANGLQTVGAIGFGEELGFNNSRPISEGQEFHRLTCYLVMSSLFDDESTSNDGLADKSVEAVNWTI